MAKKHCPTRRSLLSGTLSIYKKSTPIFVQVIPNPTSALRSTNFWTHMAENVLNTSSFCMFKPNSAKQFLTSHLIGLGLTEQGIQKQTNLNLMTLLSFNGHTHNAQSKAQGSGKPIPISMIIPGDCLCIRQVPCNLKCNHTIDSPVPTTK